MCSSRTVQKIFASLYAVVIAGFKADFQPGQPKPGWHYYWNGNGAMGDTNACEELHWNGGKNYVVGDAGHPAPASEKFLFLSNGKGHPGQGPFQTFGTGDENEHAIVLAFTVPEAGRYVIRDSFITRPRRVDSNSMTPKGMWAELGKKGALPHG